MQKERPTKTRKYKGEEAGQIAKTTTTTMQATGSN